jgi:Na+/proline symporter
MRLSGLDILIVAVYLATLIGVGTAVKRAAARGLHAYFLGERRMPWWALAMSGSSSYFDITGTMWIVSLLIVLGLRGMWVQCIWGFFISVFYMAYMGRWIRRSEVMTGAEWMAFRFGAGAAGSAARLAYTVYAVLTVTAFCAFSAVGMGKFVSVFVDVNPQIAAACIICLAGVYVIMGGFQGMILVEVVQTIVLSTGAVLVCILGFRSFDHATFARLVPAEWWNLRPLWKLEYARDSAFYLFGALVLVYVAKGFLLTLSGPEQLFDFQRFLAARNARDAQKLGALWGVIHTIRWPLTMAVAVLAIGAGARPEWRTLIARDPERALPIVLSSHLPHGVTGFAIAALLSGFLASFSSNVNAGASYLVKDIYKLYVNPRADERRLVRAGYLASLLLVAAGIAISFFATSIDLLFTWIMGTLGAGVLVPNVLRWYWWRINGWGYAWGAFAGMAMSLAQVVAELKGMALPLYVSFPVIAGSVGVITLAASLATPPPPMDHLSEFYRRTSVWGAWGPVRRANADFQRESTAGRDLASVLCGLPALVALYLGPMFVILHDRTRAASCGAVLAVFCLALYFVWYRRLPAS